MKLPNWFKIIWWVLLLSAPTYFLYCRYPDLVGGRSSYADVVVFLIWVALFLYPLFQEISFFGVTLKREVESLRGDVKELRNDIRNSVDVRSQFNPSITLGVPPPDSQLPEIEKRFRNVLDEFAREHNLSGVVPPAREINVEDDVLFLFGVRYNIEKELRRIARQRIAEEERRRYVAIPQLIRMLAEYIHPELLHIAREVYSVTSPAIHGEDVSQEKVAFVRDVAPRLVATLRSI